MSLGLKVFVVGHDWGAIVAWWLCLFSPDRVKALVNTSVPFSPRNPKFKPLDMLRASYGENYYISRFQVFHCLTSLFMIVMFVFCFYELVMSCCLLSFNSF